MHFLFSGAESGEPGVLATFQENSTQLERIAGGFGWSFADADVRVLGRSPVDLYVDEWVYELLECIDREFSIRPEGIVLGEKFDAGQRF